MQALVKMISIRSRSGRVPIQKNSQNVAAGKSHLKDLLLKMTVMTIKIQVPHLEIWVIKDLFSLRIRTLICTEISRLNFSAEPMVIGKSRPFFHPTLS